MNQELMKNNSTKERDEDLEKLSFSDVTENIKDYLETRYELALMKTADKGSTIGASAVSWILTGTFIFLSMLFLSLALGFYLSYLFDNFALGFLCTAGIFIVVTIVLIKIKKNYTIKKIKNIIINEFFDED